jgi:acyl-CoA thioesterase FadM
MSTHRVHVHTSVQPIRWGDMDVVWIDRASGKSVPLPERLEAALRPAAA